MGRTVAYVVTAVLLGVVAMLPVMVFTPKRADQSYYVLWGEPPLQFRGDLESLQQLEGVEAATVPSGPLHIGLMLAFSFVFALGVCLYSKRRMF